MIEMGLFLQYMAFSNWQITEMLVSLKVAHDFYLQVL